MFEGKRGQKEDVALLKRETRHACNFHSEMRKHSREKAMKTNLEERAITHEKVSEP